MGEKTERSGSARQANEEEGTRDARRKRGREEERKE